MIDLYVDTDTGNDAWDGTSATFVSGTTGPKATLFGAEALVTGTLTDDWIIHCVGAAADTTAVTFTGWTASGHSVTIQGDLVGSVWDDTKYHLLVANATAVTVSEDYVYFDRMQIGKSSSSADTQQLIVVTGLSAGANEFRLSNSIIKGAGGTTYYENGVLSSSANNNVTIWNTIIYNIAVKTASGSEVVRLTVATANVYSSTFIGGYRGLRIDGGTVNAKNTYIGGSGSEDWYYGAGTLNKTNCASEDASADDTGAGENATNCIVSIALNTTNFMNVTGGSEDYRLPFGSGLIDQGVSTSAESPPLDFTTDITGATRSGTWDIGAFEYDSGLSGLSVNIAEPDLGWSVF